MDSTYFATDEALGLITAGLLVISMCLDHLLHRWITERSKRGAA